MKSNYVYIALIVVVIGGLVLVRQYADPSGATQASTRMDTFAQCLTDAGAKFYGAYWCPHCQEQKKLLENSKNMPYIECSTPNGNGQLAVCTEAGIQGYPTWIFADGSRVDHAVELSELSEKTGCTLPVE